MTILSLIAIGLVGCSPTRQESSSSTSQKTITVDDAIRLSLQACEGKVDVPADVQAVVIETKGNFVVTFPQPFQPEVLHGDIYVRVTIDKATGKITEMESSP